MFTTNPIPLKTLLESVSTGKIQLPDFQRGWVWDDERIKGLLASISRGFPVGAIMTLSAGGDIRFKARLVEGVEDGVNCIPDQFLLDGQQRLTSLYQSLVHNGPVETQTTRKQHIRRWYYIDMLKALNPLIDREDVFVSVPETKQITVDFGRQVVLDLSSPELEYHHHMMPTEQLMDGMTWMFAYNSYWATNGASHPTGDLSTFINEFNKSILTTFSGYSLPVINLERETPKEAVCKVFEKVNTGGVTLNVFELVTASFAADDFRLRDDWSERCERMRSGFGVLQGVEGEHFLQAVALLTTYDRRKRSLYSGTPENQAPGISCKKEAILNLNLADYRNWADAVEIGFEEAAKFLHSQFVFRHGDVPYSTQLVPLAALYVELDKELQPANSKSLLERWYWSGIFGESYGGNTETQFALDLQQVTEYVRGGSVPTLITQANFIPERLLTLRTRNSAAYKGLYSLQMKSGAADWRTGQPLSLASWESENIDIHHIFPKRWCERESDPKIPPSLYNSVINKTPIDAYTNRIIGGRSPSTYLRRLEQDIKPALLERTLHAHWIRPDILRSDDFAECFVERGLEMLQLIGSVMGKPILGGREVFQSALTSAGIEEQFDEAEGEYDTIGERAYLEAAD